MSESSSPGRRRIWLTAAMGKYIGIRLAHALVILTIVFGIYPKPVLDMSATSVQQLVNNYNTAVTAVKAASLAH